MKHNFAKGKKRHTHSAEQGNIGFGDIAKGALVGIGASVATMLILSFISSALCMLSPDPASLTLPVGIAIFCLSAVVGGVVSANGLSRDKTAAAVAGLICGTALMIISCVSALTQGLIASQYTHGVKLWVAVAARAAALPLSAVFAVLMANRRKKIRHHKR